MSSRKRRRSSMGSRCFNTTCPPLAGGRWGEEAVPRSHSPLPPTPARKGRGRIAAILLLTLLCSFCARGAAPERVVSLNLCTDQMLVLLAPEKVAALTPLARDAALSFVAPQAARLPVVRASAEAVLRLHPDLVLGAPYGAQAVLALVQREGVQ